LDKTMRERRYLTFDMNNPRHQAALELLSAQPDKMRSEFVIDCILKAKQEERLEGVIRQTISEALAGIPLHVADTPTSNTTSELQTTESLSDLPEDLASAMDIFAP